MKLISILVIVNLTLLGLWYPDRYPMLDFPIFRKIKSGDVAMVSYRDLKVRLKLEFQVELLFLD